MHPTSQIVGIHILFRNLSQALYEHSTLNFMQSLFVILQHKVFSWAVPEISVGGMGVLTTLSFFKFIIIFLIIFSYQRIPQRVVRTSLEKLALGTGKWYRI